MYGNPSGTYYYADGLLEYIRNMQAAINETEVCLINIKVQGAELIMAVAVDDFLAAASIMKAIDDFYDVVKTKFDIKLLGRPRRYLGRHFHYHKDGNIALSQRLLIDKTLKDGDMIHANGKYTPYTNDEAYQPPSDDDIVLLDTAPKYKQIVHDPG